MVEFVYARHDFIPEHDDEVSFHAGDRIEVLEKDEQYADGWWLVRSVLFFIDPEDPLSWLVSRNIPC
jgi:hypothetical protein